MNPPSHLPPYNISLGHPHAPAPSMLYPASDVDWQFDSYMIVYMLEWVADFIMGGSKITADGDCSQEIKRCLLLERKVMKNLGSIFKSRHYFVNKGPSSQSYGFSSGHVWMSVGL